MRIPAVVTRYGETVMMPLFLVGVYAAFVATSGMHGVALWVSVAFLAIVVVLWFAFLRLKIHAQASRLAGIGDPEGLLALVARELPRCLTERARRRRPRPGSRSPDRRRGSGSTTSRRSSWRS